VGAVIHSIRPSAAPVGTDEARPLTDDELVAGLLDGDRRLAVPLYRALRPVIDHTLRRVLHGRHRDFDDLMQITFERVLVGLGEGKFAQRSSLRTWAAAIATHVALDALRSSIRHEKRFELSTPLTLEASGVRPEGRLEALSELRKLQSILSDMNPDMAETVILHDVLGYDLAEVAQMRGASTSATQSRLFRGRIELKRRAEKIIVRRKP
jgi:RNA polymerase sigma factor (sigma-70 family)